MLYTPQDSFPASSSKEDENFKSKYGEVFSKDTLICIFLP